MHGSLAAIEKWADEVDSVHDIDCRELHETENVIRSKEGPGWTEIDGPTYSQSINPNQEHDNVMAISRPRSHLIACPDKFKRNVKPSSIVLSPITDPDVDIGGPTILHRDKIISMVRRRDRSYDCHVNIPLHGSSTLYLLFVWLDCNVACQKSIELDDLAF